MTFVVFMFFSTCPHLHVHLHSPWFYVTACVKIHDHLWYKLAGGSHAFSSWENKSCMQSICTDIYVEVSGHFHPNFDYTPLLISWTQIWHRGGARFYRVLLHGSVECSSIRFPTFPLSSLVWSFSSSVSSSDIDCADECWASDLQVTMTPPHLATGWGVTFVFLQNGWFITPVKVLHMAGCAIDQHCLWNDHSINLSFAKSCVASAVRWFDPDRFPNMVYITSDFRRRQFGVYAFHSLLILVYTICWHARRCFVIFGCHIIPVHGLHYRVMWPRGYSLDSVVTLLCSAITVWDISTSVSYSYASFVCENKGVCQWPGRPGFNPRSSHTKDFKNGTWYHLA